MLTIDEERVKLNTGVHAKICEELNALYSRKNKDYGDSFHASFVEDGLVMAKIRMSDKLSRFKTLMKKDPNDICVKDETIRDTLLDLANYAIMTVMEMDQIVSSKVTVDINREELDTFVKSAIGI